jgi:NADPH:quinone reductase-like Zn-dependent oxidoreductase
MKAARVHGFGQPIQIDEIPVPQPGPGQILIQVKAAAVNPVDWKIAAGYLPNLPQPMPLTLGCELAGIVTAIGANVTNFASGDRVFGYGSLLRNGAYAEYFLADAQEFAKIPHGVSFAHAAAVPVALFTALDGLEVQATVHPGDRVLVLGGAGGVGSMAIHVAKHHGAFVYATASARNQDRLQELGADVAIDYANPDLPKDVDIVFDAVGGDAAVQAAPALKPDGAFVSPAYGQVPGAKYYGIQPDGARLAAYPIAALPVNIDQEFPLTQAAAAVAYSQTGRTRGKILLIP